MCHWQLDRASACVAETALLSYNEAVHKHGRPRRICSDHGAEIVLVKRDMISVLGEDARPAIVGSSVHNQRIERHWPLLGARCFHL